MKQSIKNLLVSALAITFVASGAGLSAQADPAPTVTIVNTGTSLAGSAVTNFDPTEILRLTLSIDVGDITVALGSSGALTAPHATFNGQIVSITGTEDQLNAALTTTTLSENCSTARTISASVVEGTDDLVFDSANSHWYELVTSAGISPSDSKTAADAATLPNSTGHGYLATITSAAENTFINNHFSATAIVGGSDAAAEGVWYWVDGPESGTKFYENNAAFGNAFTNFAPGEPNNSNGNENYLQLWSSDTWNDIASSDTYLVEFGGMAGDSFSAVKQASATATLTVPRRLSGAGTAASPYLLVTPTDLNAVQVCSGAGTYFQQTDDIAIPNPFSGFGSFSGHYDGNDKTIDLTSNTSFTSPLFNSISGATLATDTTVSHLSVLAPHDQQGNNFGQAAVFANAIGTATIDGVQLSGALVHSDMMGGLLAVTISNSVVRNTSVQGEIDPMFFIEGAGALAARASDSQFINVQCNLSFGLNMQDPFIDMINAAGGCVGDSSNNVYRMATGSGEYLVNGQQIEVMSMRSVGGLVGMSSGDTISDSSSNMALNLTRGYATGGLVGDAQNLTVNRSFASGAVNSVDGYLAGGLVGHMSSSLITDSYALGDVTADQNPGALVGQMDNGSLVNNAYATGVVTVGQGNESHGLIGSATNSNVVSSFWKLNSTGVPFTVSSIGTEVPKLDGELKNINTYSGWNMSATPNSTNFWAICQSANGGYPYLNWQTVDGSCPRTLVPGGTAAITGANYVGATLTATTANWDSLATLAYQWSLDGSPIVVGGNAQTITPIAAMKGKVLSVTVTGSNGPGYNSIVVTVPGTKIAGAPTSKVTVIGGFAAGAKVASAATKAAVKAMLKKVDLLVTVKCDAFATGKKLTPKQKVLANARAAAVCALITAAKPGSVVSTANSVAKKTDKLKEGVRVTVTSVQR